MTTSNYKPGMYHVNPSAFGGAIDPEDFNTSFPNKNRIGNQADADNFYHSVNNRKIKQQNEQKYKDMTFEELKKMKIISNTDGRPSSVLTDEKWQKEFSIRKIFITPHRKDIKKLGGKYAIESGMWNEETQDKYYGCTNWQSYCSFINDVLNNIRSGQIDYCYYIYQIMELAKFHYHTLKTKYCDGYWEVWLENERMS